MKSSPCKDCPDRCVGCHAKCEKYLSWKKHEEELEAIRKAKEADIMYMSHVGRVREAFRRKKR